MDMSSTPARCFRNEHGASNSNAFHLPPNSNRSRQTPFLPVPSVRVDWAALVLQGAWSRQMAIA